MTQKRTILILRLLMAGLFLYSGINKVLDNFTASQYLVHATSGPFKDLFATLAGNVVVDSLVIYGEILIGLALLLGIATRFTCFMGILMMSLFYLSSFPPEHGVINEQIIYAMNFIILMVFGAGRFWGMDSWIEKRPAISRYLRYLT